LSSNNKKKRMSRVAVITGCSTGVGLHLAKLLASSEGKHTYKVYATMRNLDKQTLLQKETANFLDKNLFIRQLDVCNDASVDALIKQVLKEQGKIDILVNNAGVGLSGIPESLPMSSVKGNFETNFFGVVRTTTAVLSNMKANNTGRIINVSSMGGVNGVPFNEYYCAAKFALEGYSESIAPLLRQFNIFITLVEPGPILTSFVSNAIANSAPINPEKENPGADVAGTGVVVDEKTKKLFETYYAKMAAGFNPTTAETGEEVAAKIKGLLEEEKPVLRVQTNPNYQEYAKMKLVDSTGENVIDFITKRFF